MVSYIFESWTKCISFGFAAAFSMLCSTNVKISLNQSKVCRIGINWTFMHINVLTAHDFGKVVLLLRDRWSMCPCITQPSFLHSWLWMEVDKLQEITHIQPFPLALFIASCLLFYYFFSSGSITFSSRDFKILISVTKVAPVGSRYSSAVSWLAAKEAYLLFEKGRDCI